MASDPENAPIDDPSDPAATYGATPFAPALVAPGAGTVLAGRYTLTEEIGAGGMGSVWAASQTSPVKRRVAVKLIKAGMDSRQVLTRFEAERQALAMMDHPNIAKVLDGGLTPDGRPFFVMELVRGMPITRYCDEQRLTPRERLELFVPVCQAIQHAHQKGIIHRDIKPSNVLVALYDNHPVPKVIDFGVAKATGQQLSEETLNTGLGAIVGTPEYMSPEQAMFSNLDVDTRSDIYSLGALLYELLTGSPPFAREDLDRRGLMEILRVVREEDPPKPSTRISGAPALPALSEKRRTEPRKLTALLRNELDWIVLKALEKDRVRRYETATGLAADVQRYLAGEPVAAHPPSVAYRTRKFLHKHRGPAVAACLVFAALLAGVIGTTSGLLEARRQQRIAEHETAEKEQARRQEAQRAQGERMARLDAQANATLAGQRLIQVQAEQHKAEEEKAIAQAVNDFLQTKLLRQADSQSQADALLRNGRHVADAKVNPTVRELLDRAADELAPDKIEGAFPNQPRLQAEILHTVGRTYIRLGEYKRAVGLLRRAADLGAKYLPADDPAALACLASLASAYRHDGMLNEAIEMFQRVADGFAHTLGPNHPSTLSTRNNLAEACFEAGREKEALALYERLRDDMIQTHGADGRDTLEMLNNLGVCYRYADRLNEAIPLLDHVHDAFVKQLGPDHPATFTVLANLANAYQSAGRTDEAIAMYEKVRDAQTKKLGPDHPDTLGTLFNLAGAYRDAGRLKESIDLYEKVLAIETTTLGPDHPSTLSTRNDLAAAYLDADRVSPAIAMLEEVRSARLRKMGPDALDTINTSSTLALAYQRAGRLDEAIALFEKVLAQEVKLLGRDHHWTQTTINNLAVAYWSAKRLDKSVPLFEDLLKKSEAKFGRAHPETQTIVLNLGINYKDCGRETEAVALLEEAYRAASTPARRSAVAVPLFDACVKAGRRAQVAKLARELVDEARRSFPKQSTQLAATLMRSGLPLLQIQAYSDAEPLLRESLSIWEKALPGVWITFSTQSMLGGALAGQKKYALAEPLLLDGFEGLRAQEKTIPPAAREDVVAAVDRLIELYAATEKPDAMRKWQAERDKYAK